MAKIARKSTSVAYEFFAVPQHIPLELLAIIPPTLAVLIDAGSGPICRPIFASQPLASLPITPGCKQILSPCAETAYLRQLS